MRGFTAALAFVIVGAVSATAHDVDKGPNGGRVVEAPPHHLELVVEERSVTVFVTDSAEKPVAVTGFKGLAILTMGGKVQRVALAPADGTRLSGTAAVALPRDVGGVVQLTGPDGKTAQGRFQ
jgi:hypothetical protein